MTWRFSNYRVVWYANVSLYSPENRTWYNSTEAEESTYKNEIDRNMKIHEGMYFPCNVPPSFCTSQNCLDFLVLTKIGLKRIKWCERFSDFNRMWGKNLQNFKRFITEKTRIAIFFEIAQIPGKKVLKWNLKKLASKEKKVLKIIEHFYSYFTHSFFNCFSKK